MNSNEWVDVAKEGLPKYNGRFLCCEKTITGRIWCEIYCFSDDLKEIVDATERDAGFYSWDSDYGAIDVTEYVMYWMELPAMPKKEEVQNGKRKRQGV